MDSTDTIRTLTDLIRSLEAKRKVCVDLAAERHAGEAGFIRCHAKANAYADAKLMVVQAIDEIDATDAGNCPSCPECRRHATHKLDCTQR